MLPESIIDKLSIEKVFTWTSDSEQDTWTDEVVIELFDSSIADAIELRNLEVNGLSSLLKVTDPELVAEVTSEDYLRKFELDDNKIELTTVKDFSRNLRRTLISIIASFGMVIALLLVSNVFTLYSLRMIYHLSDYEELFAKYLLGFSRWQRYKLLYIFWFIALLAQLIIVILTHSYFALLLGMSSSLLLLVTINILTREKDLDRYKKKGIE